MNDENGFIKTDDFNEDLPYIELQSWQPEDLHLLYKSVSVHLDKWPGGDAEDHHHKVIAVFDTTCFPLP